MTIEPAIADFGALARAVGGAVTLPDSDGYERARRPAIPRFDGIRPQAVVACTTEADVAATIAFARRAGLHVAVRSGGHCFAGRSSTAGIVIDVGPLRSVAVADGRATIGAGARLGDVYDALDRDGLTIAAGCGPEVGIAGLVLGGGLGILGRSAGLTCDQLVAARVVLADGRVVDCDAQRESELLWALRGAGGGQFGVVTRFVLRTLPAPAATTLHLVWPHGEAAALLDAWQSWAPAAPDGLAASLLLTAGRDPERPPAVHVFGAMIGSVAETTEQLASLAARAGADPASSALEPLPYREAKRHLAEHGPADEEVEGGQMYCKSEFFARPLPAHAIAALIEHLAADRVDGQSRELDLTPWGGAYNRVRADATAFPHRDERFLLKHAVTVDAGADTRAARDWLGCSWALTHPWGSGGAYVNFPDPELEDSARAYHGANLERLRRAKSTYDPGNFFRFHQSLERAR